jgi:hypothetical protein
VLHYCCFCIKSQRVEKIKFHDKFMKVKLAVEPDLILWQNFGVSKKSRFFRSIVFIFFTSLVLSFCFYGILQLERFIQKTEIAFPSQINCVEDKVSLTEASADFYSFESSDKDQTGDFYCFCNVAYKDNGIAGLKMIVFPSYDE